MIRWLSLFTSWGMLLWAPPQPHALAAHRLTVEEQIIKIAWEKQIPPDLALRLAWEESHFLPGLSHKEINGTVSTGVMMLNSGAFKNVSRMTVEQNIRAGLDYFASLYARCRGSARCAVRAYRSGVVRHD